MSLMLGSLKVDSAGIYHFLVQEKRESSGYVSPYPVSNPSSILPPCPDLILDLPFSQSYPRGMIVTGLSPLPYGFRDNGFTSLQELDCYVEGLDFDAFVFEIEGISSVLDCIVANYVFNDSIKNFLTSGAVLDGGRAFIRYVEQSFSANLPLTKESQGRYSSIGALLGKSQFLGYLQAGSLSSQFLDLPASRLMEFENEIERFFSREVYGQDNMISGDCLSLIYEGLQTGLGGDPFTQRCGYYTRCLAATIFRRSDFDWFAGFPS